jgi:hypothetical protein
MYHVHHTFTLHVIDHFNLEQDSVELSGETSNSTVILGKQETYGQDRDAVQIKKRFQSI